MARVTRYRRRYGTLRFKRRKSLYGRRFSKRYGRFSKFRRGRGMQRIQKRRFPARNPFGDKVQLKFKFTAGGQLHPASGPNTQFVQVTGAFNDLATAETVFGTCPGFTVYPTLFQNYRVTGCKIRFMPIYGDSVTGNYESIAYVMGSDGILASPTVSTLPEQRWCSYRVMNQFQTGGAVKPVSLYLSTMKVAGADRSIANDDDYTGTTNLTAPFYNAVPEQLGFQFGLCALNGSNLTASYLPAPLAKYMVSFTYYVTFWGRRSIVT